MTEHNLLTGASLHEPKDIAAATSGQIYIADGAASGTMTTPISTTFPPAAGTVTQGFWDYNDLATTSTPIALTLADTFYELPNDGAGARTQLSYALDGFDNIWDVATDRFDWTNGTVLSLGDTVDIRFDVDFITGSVNTDISLSLELGIGGPTPFTLPIIIDKGHAAADTYDEVHQLSFYIATSDTLDYPARVTAAASKTGTTVIVNGWFVRALHTNA